MCCVCWGTCFFGWVGLIDFLLHSALDRERAVCRLCLNECVMYKLLCNVIIGFIIEIITIYTDRVRLAIFKIDINIFF